MSKEKATLLSGGKEGILQHLVDYHNHELSEIEKEKQQTAEFLERNPHLSDSKEIHFKLGRIAGRDEELNGFRAMLTMAAAEASGRLVVPETIEIPEEQ